MCLCAYLIHILGISPNMAYFGCEPAGHIIEGNYKMISVSPKHIWNTLTLKLKWNLFPPSEGNYHMILIKFIKNSNSHSFPATNQVFKPYS